MKRYIVVERPREPGELPALSIRNAESGVEMAIVPYSPGCIASALEFAHGAAAWPTLLAALPTVPHPGGPLNLVVAHYKDGSKQMISGAVVEAATATAKGELCKADQEEFERLYQKHKGDDAEDVWGGKGE